jgi:hypothetical protein
MKRSGATEFLGAVHAFSDELSRAASQDFANFSSPFPLLHLRDARLDYLLC